MDDRTIQNLKMSLIEEQKTKINTNKTLNSPHMTIENKTNDKLHLSKLKKSETDK